MYPFRMPRFILRWLRRNTHPMEEKKAYDMKTKLSVIYAIIAWNAFGAVLLMCATGKRHWPTYYGIRSPEEDMVRPAIQWAHTLNITKADVVRISGLTKVSEDSFDITENPEGASETEKLG